MKKLTWILITLVAFVLSSCNGGGISTPPGSGIAVRMASTSAKVDEGTIQSFSATVDNDPSNAGVTWTLSGGGTISNVTASSVTYTAPGTTGSASLKATSVANPSKSSTLALTINILPTVGNSSLPDGILGIAYNAPLAVNGGSSPFTWGVTTGTLPTGLTLNAGSGSISGTPSAPGASNFTIQVTDGAASPQSSTLSKSLTIRSPLAITPGTPAAAVMGTPYAFTFAATGGAAPYVWSVSAGALPAGLTLNANTGAVSGTPTASGNSSFTIQVTDGGSPAQTATLSSSITTAQHLAVTVSVLLDATIGSAYSASVTATGGTSPLNYSVSQGSLPAGLTLNATTGAITGTPTALGTGNFTIQVSDSSTPAQTATQALSLRVNAIFAINTATLPNAINGLAFSTTLASTGGVAPLTWSVSAGTLPAGLTLNATTGVLSGTPSAVSTTNLTIQATDSASPPRTVTKALSLVVNSPITFSSTPLPNGTTGVSYTASPSGTGGVSPYTWSVSIGNLPTGLSINTSTGAISGTPSVAGTYNFTILATDSAVPPQVMTDATSIVIHVPLAVSQSSLPSAAVGAAYTAALTAAGAPTPLTWSIAAGSLPPGLTLSSAGGISGTPTTLGTSNFTVQVVDSATPARTATQALSITVNSHFAVTSSAPPNATLLILYSYVPTTSGGTAPLTWSISTGSLPAGLTFNTTNGTISGIPTATGTSNFTLQVSDSSVPAQSASFPTSITVNPILSISVSSLANAILGTPFNVTLTAAGAVAPLTWSVSAGALPTGLTLNASTGVISGTPTAAGTTNFTVQVADSAVPPRTATQALGITVNSALAITPITLPDAVLGLLYNTNVSATGGVGPYTWSVSAGALPTGVNINASTGALSGTPTGTGTANFTLHVADSSVPPQTATLASSVRVSGVLSILLGALPNAIQGLPYSATLSGSGGVAPFTWSVSAGTLPAGLTLNASTGAITGTPTATGTTNFTIQVTDSEHPAQVKTLAESIVSNSPLSIVTLSLPNAVLNALFNTTLTTTGGVGPITWAVSAGTMPGGLTLNATTGVITGTPTSLGPASFTVQATDSSTPPQVKTQALGITVNPLLSITSTLLPNAVNTLLYNTTLTTTGGVGPITWSVSAGTLPTGLALNASTGVISGTPSVVGPVNFTIKATDSSTPPQTATQNLSVSVNAVLSITSTILANAVNTILYNTTLTTTGGVGPITWSISAGTLPTGLSLDASTGVISGIPTVLGSAAFTLKATDSSTPAQTAVQPVSIVTNALLAIPTITLPNAITSVLFNTTLTATGGVGPITWSISAGTLPTGLTLNATTGVISGTPTALGTVNFTIKATDSSVPAQTATQAVSLKVNALLTITSTTLANAINTVLYNTTLTTSGGVGPISWSISAGTLPAGLTLNATTGVISGVPTSLGSVNFTIKATDSSVPAQTATQATSISINSLLSITSTILPNAVQTLLYNTTLTATGGVGPITWSVSAGTLPTGLSLNASTGVLGGTPSVLGTTNFTIKATDSSVPPQTATQAVSLKANALLNITSTVLPDAIASVLYNTTLTTTGGVGPITWAVSTGTLPTGVTLNAATGVLTGTPTGVLTSNFTIQATDSATPPQVQTLAVKVNVFAKLAITPISLAPGLLNDLLTTSLAATGGSGTYTWSISAGALPSGVTLNASTGVLTGTPLASGSFSFTVQVTDTANPAQTATLALGLNITPLGVNNSLFNGQYAFLFQGFDSNGAVAIAGSITAQGNGVITGGTLDINRVGSVQTDVAITSGTFAVNSDNRGVLTLTTANGTQNFRVALNAAGALARFIEFDSVATGVIRGNGVIKKQNSAAFSNPSITGNYAFGFSGSTSTGARSGLIGSFVTNGSGGISSGLLDSNSNGTVLTSQAVTNTSTYSVTNTGRGTLTIKSSTLGSVSGVVYVVSASDLLFVRTDAIGTGSDLLTGEIRQQTGAPFASLPLASTSVLYLSGNSSATTTSVGAGLVITALGIVTGTYDSNDNGTVTSTLLATGSHSISSSTAGRGSLTFAGNSLTFYLVDSTDAFVMDAAGAEVKTGMFEGQTLLPINLAGIVGNYIEGSSVNTNNSVTFESGIVALPLLGSLTGTIDSNTTGDTLDIGNLISDVLSLGATGRITLGTTNVSYVVSGTRQIVVEVQSGQTNARIIELDQ